MLTIPLTTHSRRFAKAPANFGKGKRDRAREVLPAVINASMALPREAQKMNGVQYSNVGVIVNAVGNFPPWLRNCVGSLLQTNSHIPFILLADHPCDFPFHWVIADTDQASLSVKTEFYRYSPYSVTLAVDDNAVFCKQLDPIEMLGGSEIALALEARAGLGTAQGLEEMSNNYEELKETISTCGETAPVYSTSIMVWRKSPRVARLFERWNKEWSRFRGSDQLALARALKLERIKPRILPQCFNESVFERKRNTSSAIYFLHPEAPNCARNLTLWRPLPAGPFELAYARAVTHGLMSENQYHHIARELCWNRPSNLLSFGGGHDSELWFHCVEKNVAYVESNSRYLPILPVNPVLYEFRSRVGRWSRVPAPAQAINQPWDYVLIDGPPGFNRDLPGRQIPVAWAARLARKAIFVHDYERPWERAVCDKYLGRPTEILLAPGRNDRCLAVFRLRGQRI